MGNIDSMYIIFIEEPKYFKYLAVLIFILTIVNESIPCSRKFQISQTNEMFYYKNNLFEFYNYKDICYNQGIESNIFFLNDDHLMCATSNTGFLL